MSDKLITGLTPNVKHRNIGLIGAGRMGTGIGVSLIRHHATLNVKGNVNREGINRLVDLGATEHSCVARLARSSDIIVLSLPSSREVEAVCLGADGLFANLSPGDTIIDCTTSKPSSTIALAAEAVTRQIRFVDAPVTRSPEQAEQGCLNAIVGADAESFTEATGTLAAFCEAILHAGPVGSGHKMKIVYNAMTMSLAAVSAEICQLAGELDVDLDGLRTIVSRGATNSGIFQKFCAFLLNEDPTALSIAISLAAKDIGYALEAARDAGAFTPVLECVTQKLHAAVNAGKGGKTLPHLAGPR